MTAEVFGQQVRFTSVVSVGYAVKKALISVLWFEHLLYVGFGAKVVVEIGGHEPCHWFPDDGDVGVVG